MKTDQEYILCTAIWYKEQPTPTYTCVNTPNGVVLCGHRHPHIIHQHVALLGKKAVEMGEYIQGFLTSKNRFVDRREARLIAYKAKQGTNTVIGSELYSEDLY